jgi:hypothetical protein
MPLPISEVERELTHTRRLRYEGYKRADGLWDIEAHLGDVKNHDYHLMTGVRRAGQLIHDMSIRLTIDRKLNVLDVVAVSDAVPYPGGCEQAAPVYRKLIGANLQDGFRRRVQELVGGVQGCTHITELLGGIPTAAIQTFAGEMREDRDDGRKPFQLDQCLALDTSGETVRRWYPKWYRGAGAAKESGNKSAV